MEHLPLLVNRLEAKGDHQQGPSIGLAYRQFLHGFKVLLADPRMLGIFAKWPSGTGQSGMQGSHWSRGDLAADLGLKPSDFCLRSS